MLKEERLKYIINQINVHNKVLSADLSQQLNVSEDTVRRDLKGLTDSGQVIKVHGGAVSKSFHFPYAARNVYKKEEKKEIARKAIGLIDNGMIIVVGGGTTMIEMARLIPNRLFCTFFTISPIVAVELAEHPNLTVNLIGGKVASDTQICVGAQVVQQLSEIEADLCLMGTNSVSTQKGITDSDWEAVQVKKAMIRSAQDCAILSISEKLDSAQKIKVCNLTELSYLITDLKPTDRRLKKYATQIHIV
jgi:DeoR/GlpR family transcriptional regulator of sugar metabolism